MEKVMIRYVKVKSNFKGDLPEIETLDELRQFLCNLEVELALIEVQLNDFERFNVWPKSNWKCVDEWLDCVLNARRIKTWQLTIVKATLNEIDKDEILDKRIKQLRVEISELYRLLKREKDVRVRLIDIYTKRLKSINNKRINLGSNTASRFRLIFSILHSVGLLPDGDIKRAIENNPSNWSIKE